jgi:hypothetical protein
MRLLGQGQTVVFCVSDEIRLKIHEQTLKAQSAEESTIAVSDILAWAITETWKDAKRNISLWATQGRRFEQHQALWDQCREDGAVNLVPEKATGFLEDEATPLERRYRPIENVGGVGGLVEEADAITLRCQQFKNLELRAAALSEEQERELAPEIEQEREDQRPPPAEAITHYVHPDVREFVRKGTILPKSTGYTCAFQSLRNTSVSSCFDLTQFMPGLLVTWDFSHTVIHESSDDVSDLYQRSVQWILTGSDIKVGPVKHMMIISPYEAQVLYLTIQTSKYVALHLYAPRANLGYSPLDRLDLYTVPWRPVAREIPRALTVELNLFAGQLYVNSYDEYIEVCEFLGIAWEPAKDGEVIAADGFILRDLQGRVGGKSGLRNSPVAFMKILMTKIRRNCAKIDKTHMGQILDNELLTAGDFE